MLREKPETSYDEDYLRNLEREKEISTRIIDFSRSMITIINRDYNYEKANATFCKAHGIKNDSIIGRSLADVWGDDIFKSFIKKKIDQCLAGETIRYEASFETPHLGTKYFEVIFRPLSIGNGEVTHLLAETTDINELIQSRQAVIEKEEEFRAFETNLPIGFIRVDPQGEIIHANNKFLSIMECGEKIPATGINIRDFYVGKGIFELQLEQLAEYNTRSFGRVTLKNCKGKTIPCRLSAYIAMDDVGKPSYIDFAVADSSRELMLENRLLQAQKLETIGALAGGIAHDFNNILATISGYAEMLQEDLQDDSAHSEKASRIMSAVSRGLSLTKQILTFSRQVEQEKVHVSVREVLKETIGFIRPVMPAGIKIRSSLSKSNALVYADPTQLFRVFLNLMTNAFQAMEEKGGKLAVTLTVVEGCVASRQLNRNIVADKYVLVSFRDTGIGMEPSLLKRIFEPFFTTRDFGKGTGLGLSVVHGIVSEMEGEILVSSEKDKGSAFNIYLPVSKESAEAVLNNPRKKILFFTGNIHESRILIIALENSGFDLIKAKDNNDLYSILKEPDNRPDLMIYMADTEMIRQKELEALFGEFKISIPCILITDPENVTIEENLLNSEIIKQHLQKPVSLRELRDAIQSVIK
jgi:PAS domain S-box-containing protein